MEPAAIMRDIDSRIRDLRKAMNLAEIVDDPAINRALDKANAQHYSDVLPRQSASDLRAKAQECVDSGQAERRPTLREMAIEEKVKQAGSSRQRLDGHLASHEAVSKLEQALCSEPANPDLRRLLSDLRSILAYAQARISELEKLA